MARREELLVFGFPPSSHLITPNPTTAAPPPWPWTDLLSNLQHEETHVNTTQVLSASSLDRDGATYQGNTQTSVPVVHQQEELVLLMPDEKPLTGGNLDEPFQILTGKKDIDLGSGLGADVDILVTIRNPETPSTFPCHRQNIIVSVSSTPHAAPPTHLISVAYLVDQDQKHPIQAAQSTPLMATNSDAIGLDYLHPMNLHEVAEQDEVSRSYVTTPETSLPFLGQDIIDPTTITHLGVTPEIGVETSIVMERFEANLTLPYGQHSTYRLLHAGQPMDSFKAGRAGHVKSSNYSLFGDYSNRASVVESSNEGSNAEASVMTASAMAAELDTDFQALVLTAAYNQKGDTRPVSLSGELAKHFFGIGEHLEGYTASVDEDLVREEH